MSRRQPVLTAAFLCTLAPAMAGPAIAAEAEARAVALSANCRPGKVTLVRQVVGVTGETIYKIDCSDPRDAFVLVQCRGHQCVLLR